MVFDRSRTERTKDRERQSKRRAVRKVLKRPDTHAVNQAVTYGFMAASLRAKTPRESLLEVKITFLQVAMEAGNYLVKRGYDKDESAFAIRVRIDRLIKEIAPSLIPQRDDI